MVKKMGGMSMKDLKAMYQESSEVEMDEDAVELPEFNYSDELDALVESESNFVR